MNIPQDLLYTKTHEWLKKTEDGTALVGLTDYAQAELGDLVFVNLPMEDDAVEAGESFADVESVKAVSDVNSPVSGVVVAVNVELNDAPVKINETPYEAWLIEVGEIEDTEELMTADEYAEYLETL